MFGHIILRSEISNCLSVIIISHRCVGIEWLVINLLHLGYQKPVCQNDMKT